MTIENVLIFGNGAVGLHLYIILKNQNTKKIGIKIRDSLKTKRFLKEIKENEYMIEASVNKILDLKSYGKVKVEEIIEKNSDILDKWENFIFSTPCDTYLKILEKIEIEKLKKLKRIILISPEFGSSYLIKNFLLTKDRSDIEIISFSNYFGASNLISSFSTKIEVNALKKKVYLSSTKVNDYEIKKWEKLLKEIGINIIKQKNILDVESKNITLFVHSPFLFNNVSLNQIFLKDLQKKYLYKLYPEGPITKYVIHDMVELYHEIMKLYKKMEIEDINLLKFLNENYPVLKESLAKEEIENFQKFSKEKQAFLLYVRYSSILIDPYSIPDKEGRYFDFSRVEYSKIYQNKDKKWEIPRRPLEDYNKLNLMFYLSKKYRSKNKVIKKFLHLYEYYYNELINKVGEKEISNESKIVSRKKDAEKIYMLSKRDH